MKIAFRGHCPTIKEIENENLKELAGRLEGKSYKETLTNILEWQNRNITFWIERHPISTVFRCFVTFAIVFSFLLPLSLTMPNIQILWGPILILSGGATAILLTILWILHSNRKIPLKEVPEGLKNVFVPSISMSFLLKNRLGICRDYAKLTACLLSKVYPNEKIYFVHAPDHVATGISIENKLYMLDQRLPILTIEKWNDYRKPKKSGRIERFDLVKNSLKKVDKKVFLQTKNKTRPDTNKLAMRMAELLNISGKQTGDKTFSTPLEIPLKKGAILYEDDEMVNYSLARYIKMRVSNELVNINEVTGIEVESQKDDLIFLLNFN